MRTHTHLHVNLLSTSPLTILARKYFHLFHLFHFNTKKIGLVIYFVMNTDANNQLS